MQVVTCEDLGPRVSDVHDAVLEASSSRSIFLTRDWLDSWFDCFGSEHDIVNLAVREGADVIGAVPMVVTRPTSLLEPRRLRIAGQRPTTGEHLDLVAAEGRETSVARAAADALTGTYRRRWDVLTIQRTLEDSPVLAAFADALREAGCRVQLVSTGPSPYITLPPTFDELLAAKSKNFRSQVRQARNRLRRLGSVEVRRVGEHIELEEGFEELLRLHRARWQGGSSFDTEAKIAFHRQLSMRLVDRDRLYLSLLSIDGTTIGARYDFVYGGKIWCIQGGWDPEYAAARPGMYLTEDVVSWGASKGLEEYDFLGGESDYKKRWSTGERMLVTLVAANPVTPRGVFYGIRRKL
ncbi:MAG: GNAT family N-acetyltransferase [Acidimicrobiales bacterium]